MWFSDKMRDMKKKTENIYLCEIWEKKGIENQNQRKFVILRIILYGIFPSPQTQIHLHAQTHTYTHTNAGSYRKRRKKNNNMKLTSLSGHQQW